MYRMICENISEVNTYPYPFPAIRYCVAMQVLSNPVANVLQIFGGSQAAETAEFVHKCSKFHCLNVCSLSAGKRQRDPFKAPYIVQGVIPAEGNLLIILSISFIIAAVA